MWQENTKGFERYLSWRKNSYGGMCYVTAFQDHVKRYHFIVSWKESPENHTPTSIMVKKYTNSEGEAGDRDSGSNDVFARTLLEWFQEEYGLMSSSVSGSYEYVTEHEWGRAEAGRYNYSAYVPSELGIVYSNIQDFDGDGTGELFLIKTITKTYDNGNTDIVLNWEYYDKTGSDSESSYEVSEQLNRNIHLYYRTYGSKLVVVKRELDLATAAWFDGSIQPAVNLAALDWSDLSSVHYRDTIEVIDLKQSIEPVLEFSREISADKLHLIDYILTIDGKRYCFESGYSSYEWLSDDVVIGTESEIIQLTLSRITDIIGEDDISLSSLGWNTFWDDFEMTEPEARLQQELTRGDVSWTNDDSQSIATGQFQLIIGR